MPNGGGPTDDEKSLRQASREGPPVGARAGHEIGLRTGLAVAEPIVIVGLATIFVFWVAHALIGVKVSGVTLLLVGSGCTRVVAAVNRGLDRSEPDGQPRPRRTRARPSGGSGHRQ